LAAEASKDARWSQLNPERWLGLPGQHSLLIYLVHQPILVGILWNLRQIGWF